MEGAPDQVEEVGPLDPASLVVGQAIELSVPFKGRTVKSDTIIVGYREAKFILVAMPSLENKGLAIVPGTELSARMLSGGKLFKFKCATIRAQFTPEPLLFLGFPRQATSVDLRGSERVEISFPVVVRFKSDGARLNGEVVDLSEGGCAVNMGPEAESRASGEELTLYLRIPGMTALRRVRGILRRVRLRHVDEKLVEVSLGIQHKYEGDDDARALVMRLIHLRSGEVSAEDL